MDMGVSQNHGTPKWMVYNGKPYEQMDDLGVFPYFWKPPYVRTSMGPSKSTSKSTDTTEFPPHWAYAHRLVPSAPMVRSAIWVQSHDWEKTTFSGLSLQNVKSVHIKSNPKNHATKRRLIDSTTMLDWTSIQIIPKYHPNSQNDKRTRRFGKNAREKQHRFNRHENLWKNHEKSQLQASDFFFTAWAGVPGQNHYFQTNLMGANL